MWQPLPIITDIAVTSVRHDEGTDAHGGSSVEARRADGPEDQAARTGDQARGCST
jgi:hypothetical protein